MSLKRTVSASSASSGRRLKRRVTPLPITRIPRKPSIQYNGEFKLSRNMNWDMTYVANTGFNIGTTIAPFFFMTFSPIGITVWASSLQSFQIALPGVTDIANLFERVKIDKVLVQFTWTSQDGATNATNPGSNSGPRILAAADITDGTTGVTLAQTQQQAGAKFFSPVSPEMCSMTVYPKFQRLLYYTAAISSYEPGSGYVEPSADIPHYGLRMGVANSGACGVGRLQFNCKMFMSCKNVK